MDIEKLRSDWWDCLRRYGDLPTGDAEGSSLDKELEYLERLMLDHPPEGRVMGLVEECREPPPKEVPLEALGLKEIPEDEWIDRIRALDEARAWPLEHVWTVLDQDGVGSCASESLNGAVMCLREISNQEQVLFNPWGMYGRVNGGADAGSSLSDNLSFAQRYGCFPESVWPRSKGWRTEPSAEAYEAAKQYRLREVVRLSSKRQFGSALLLGLPVYFGYPGHAIFAVRLIDTSRFWYQNSWGKGWGQNGAGTLSFNSIQWSYGAWAILTETWAGLDNRL